jgi:serine phosphatase RsbU (regulator of sigma subunit)
MFWRKKDKPKPAEPAATWPELEEPAALSGVDGDTQFLTGDQSADRRTVRVLLDAIAQVANARVFDPKGLESLLSRIVDNSVEVTGAERGLLILEGAGGELLVRVARTKDGQNVRDEGGGVKFSTTIARRVLDEVAPVRATVGSDSEALELARSVFDLKLRAVMCVPLSATRRDGDQGKKPQGALYVDSRAAARTFTQRDLSLFAALAQQISMTMESAQLHLDSLEKVRLEQSLEIASAVQRSLMPNAPGKIPGFEVHGWYRPAEGTAGDFYDFIAAKGGRLGVVVGDVTGHGIGPALITASAQAGLRSYLRLLGDAGEALTLLNQDLCERNEDGRFLTLYLAVLSPDGTVETINAGHPAAVRYDARTKSCRQVEGRGPALGMIPDERYASAGRLTLGPGDALLLYSDGVSELRRADGEFLGDDGIAAVFQECLSEGGPLDQVLLKLAERALLHAKPPIEDDITLLVVRRTP